MQCFPWRALMAVLVLFEATPTFGDEKSRRPIVDTNGRRAASQQQQDRVSENSVPVARAIPLDGRAGGNVRGGSVAAVANPSDSRPLDVSTASAVGLPNTMQGLNDKRPLAIGDRVSFSVKEDEAQPISLMVTDSGELQVPYIGRVSIGNRTCKQLAYSIKAMLEKEYYFQATVLIGLDSYGRTAVSRGQCYLIGQVRSPGPQGIPADEILTVSKVIMRAGGFTSYANKKKVKLTRFGKQPVEIDISEVLEKGRREKDLEVGPEDIVTVPEKFWNFLSE